MKLVANWRQAWRWFSMQVLLVLACAPMIWEMLPAETKALIPEGWVPVIVTAVSIIGIIGRLKDQGLGSAGREGGE